MFNSKTEPKLVVPASEGTIVSIQAPAGVERRVVIENLDGSNTLTWRWQYSDNNTSWTDLAPDAALAPGLRVSSTLLGHIFFRLRASGNLNIALKADAEFAIQAATITFFSS